MPEEKPATPPEGGTAKVDAKQEQYTAEQVEQWRQDSENKSAWQKANTQRAQELARQAEELNAMRPGQQPGPGYGQQGYPATQYGGYTAQEDLSEIADRAYVQQQFQQSLQSFAQQILAGQWKWAEDQMAREFPDMPEPQRRAVLYEAIPESPPFVPPDYRSVIEKRKQATQSDLQRMVQEGVAAKLKELGVELPEQIQQAATTTAPSSQAFVPMSGRPPVPPGMQPPGAAGQKEDYLAAEIQRLQSLEE